MSAARLPRPRRSTLRLAGCALLLLGLVGCSAATFDSLPQWAGGEPQAMPERPATPHAYPPVHDRPPDRSAKLASQEEVARMQQQLLAAQAKQAAQARKLQSDSANVVADSQGLAAARDTARRQKSRRKTKAAADAPEKSAKAPADAPERAD